MLDDDQELLELYRCILAALPSGPEVHTAPSGARAMALLEAEPFDLLICDLKMPKIDGLQVVSIVRQKYPQLRVVVLTALHDDQYRSRAYAMGVDLFWEKPANEAELKMFQDCLESLLGRQAQAGFRGVQRKSLVDLIQLECLSQSSSVLKITHDSHEGKIWVHHGEVIDAAALDLQGEAAFKRILAWRTGNFEILPPEPERPRTIATSYQNLLLESAQALDEAQSAAAAAPVAAHAGPPAAATGLAQMIAQARNTQIEFVVQAAREPAGPVDAWGTDQAGALANWARQTEQHLRALGEELRAGELTLLVGLGPQGHVALAGRAGALACAGFNRHLDKNQVRVAMNNLLAQWAS
jgi:CheY-like chemotaxis protein